MPGYQLYWPVIWDNAHMLLAGLALALEIAAVSLVMGAGIGIFGALARNSRFPLLRGAAAAYVEFLRNVPLLLLIFFLYFGLPRLGIRFLDERASLVAAMTLYSGAYLAEIFRAGLDAVSQRYIEAGKSIGLTGWQNFRYVSLPLMFRVILPSLGTTLISLYKDTSLGAAISVHELTYAGMTINTNTWRVIESWSAVGVLYLVTSYLLSTLVRGLEKRLSRYA
jgi:His/Glu/Gln/Arg/opine family amino acid ABC transporter permease subunit